MKQTEFKKNDYIVLLNGGKNENLNNGGYHANNCYKLNKDNYFSTYLDNNFRNNSWSCVNYNDPKGQDKYGVAWRYATKEEIAEYDRLGKPYDVTTLNNKTMNEIVVHCKTLEEWEFVNSKLHKDNQLPNSYWEDHYIDETCKSIIKAEYSSLDWYGKQKNYTILSFDEWCKKNNYTFKQTNETSTSLVGRYLKALVDAPMSIRQANKGDYFIILNDYTKCKLVKNDSIWDYKNSKEQINLNVWELMPIDFNPNKPSIEEWSVGSYVVLKEDYINSATVRKGEVHQICSNDNDLWISITKSVGKACLPYKSICKWFATKSEAESFSKTLTNNEEYVPKVGEYIVYNEEDVLLVESVKLDSIHEYWVKHTPSSFSGGGFSWKSFKHDIRKALPHEIPNKTEIPKHLKNYPLIKEECFNNEIEIGDEVEVVQIKGFKQDNDFIYLKANIGDKFIVTKSPYNYTRTNEIGIQIEDNKGYCYPIECFKLIKKAKNNTTLPTNQTKKDDVLSPKVENKLLDIIKVRNSTPTKVEKKRIRLTIIKPKQLNLN